MNIKELLPIGSIVLLSGGRKKVMLIGIKQTSTENNQEYDYMGILYPEGYIGADCLFLFNHADIDSMICRGYEDKERDMFIERLSSFYEEN